MQISFYLELLSGGDSIRLIKSFLKPILAAYSILHIFDLTGLDGIYLAGMDIILTGAWSFSQFPHIIVRRNSRHFD